MSEWPVRGVGLWGRVYPAAGGDFSVCRRKPGGQSIIVSDRKRTYDLLFFSNYRRPGENFVVLFFNHPFNCIYLSFTQAPRSNTAFISLARLANLP